MTLKAPFVTWKDAHVSQSMHGGTLSGASTATKVQGVVEHQV